MRRTFVITTLAEYQTGFWLLVAGQLRVLGHDVAFLSFDDRSTDSIQRAGHRVYAGRFSADDVRDFESAAAECSGLGVSDLNHWFTHERYAFGITDSRVLCSKLAYSLRVADAALKDIVGRGETPVMVQEVGGFLCVIGAYFAARTNSVDNWFIEPSFFRGSVFFTRNSFGAPRVGPVDDRSAAASPAVEAYLEETMRSRSLVIPLKDKHHYSAAVSKVANARNAWRLAEKLFDKYVLGKHQEFGHIGHHVRTHLRMIRNGMRLSGRYSSLDALGPFVYYPLHVPADMALTLRSGEYLDQIALVDRLARAVPSTHCIVIKEHPAMIGSIDAGRVEWLLDRYDNVHVLHPSTNNYEVLQRAAAVVSVNSKSGIEAVLVGTKVIVLGDAFYRAAPGVVTPRPGEDFSGLLSRVLASSETVSREMIGRFFEQIRRQSLPGELFVAEPRNAETFAASILQATASGH